MNKTDILVIGGGPSGTIAALTAKSYYPEKKASIMTSSFSPVVPCGIPYMFATLSKPEDNSASYAVLEKNGTEVIRQNAASIDRKNKKVTTENGEEWTYEKLIICSGSLPVIPRIKGAGKKGIYPVNKDLIYLKETIEKVKKASNILVIGGGFIGVEFADEISKLGKNVRLVEALPDILSNSFDQEISNAVRERLKAQGVEILTSVSVGEFLGGESVEEASLSGGKKIKADAVILGIGAKPNSALAAAAGLETSKTGAIAVDEYMRTSDPDISAAGDCAAKKDFFTRRDSPVLLASTATAEARIAGANLYSIKVIKENKGTIAIYSSRVAGLTIGSAGLTEKTALKEGFEYIAGSFEGVDKHPASMPGSEKVKVKLVFSRSSGTLLGGQVMGGISCGELINTIGLCIQNKMDFEDIETLQIATHPWLTPPPTFYPLIQAAMSAARKI